MLLIITSRFAPCIWPQTITALDPIMKGDLICGRGIEATGQKEQARQSGGGVYHGSTNHVIDVCHVIGRYSRTDWFVYQGGAFVLLMLSYHAILLSRKCLAQWANLIPKLRQNQGIVTDIFLTKYDEFLWWTCDKIWLLRRLFIFDTVIRWNEAVETLY